MENLIEVALCGCRGHVERFGRLINDSRIGKVSAIWDNDIERGKNIAKEFNVPYINDFDELLELPNLRGVVIIAENIFHKDMIIKAAERGINVFVEKPLCINVEDAKEIREIVLKNNIKFYMSDPFVISGIIQLKRMIQEGVLGKITGARVRMCVNSAVPDMSGSVHVDYQKELHGGGVMSDIGVHALHIIQYLFGQPKSVSAMFSYYTDIAKQTGMEESAVYTMQYSDDIIVTGESSWLSPYASTASEVFGTEGYAIVKDVNRQENIQKLTYAINGKPPVTLQDTELPAHPTLHVLYWLDMIYNDWPNSIVGIDDMSNNGTGIDSAVGLVEFANAIYKSAASGRVVHLTQDHE